MPDTISTLLTRNLNDVFGENDPARRRAAIDEIFTEDCVSMSPGAFTVAATRSIASLARSRRRTPTFDISRLPRPRNWPMAGGPGGSRAVLVRLISSLPGTAGLPPFISFSTSYPELSILTPPLPSWRTTQERPLTAASSLIDQSRTRRWRIMPAW